MDTIDEEQRQLALEEERRQLVEDMIKAEFSTTKGSPDTDRGYLCFECGGESISRKDIETQHNVLKQIVVQAYKCSGVYGYRMDQVWMNKDKRPDFSGVCPYKINKGYVFFPKSRKTSSHDNGSISKCAHCGASLLKDASTDFCFCSIRCKLLCPDSQKYYTVLQWENSFTKLITNCTLVPVKQTIQQNNTELCTAAKSTAEESRNAEEQENGVMKDINMNSTEYMTDEDQEPCKKKLANEKAMDGGETNLDTNASKKSKSISDGVEDS